MGGGGACAVLGKFALASLEHMRYDTGVFVTLARQEGVT